MLVVQEQQPNTFYLIPAGSSITHNGVVYPWQITTVWSDAELAEISVYKVEEPAPVAHKLLISFHFERVGGVVTYVPQYIDIPVTTITPRQIRLALSQIGLRQPIEDWVKTQDQTTQDNWEYASEFVRDNALIVSAATALGKTSADIDALFTLAATL